MARTLTFPRVIRVAKYTELFRIHGVPVELHWTVLVVAALILAGAVKSPIVNLVGLISWLGVILLHETGHLIAARRKRCEINSIHLYPILGLIWYEAPWSAWDDCVIAWAGVLAQAVIAVPIVTTIAVFGYTRSNVVNEALAIWGFFSAGIAGLNLLPIPPLDGARAWRIVPLLFKKVFRRQKNFQVMRTGR